MAKWHECIKTTCNELVQYPKQYCEKHKIESVQLNEKKRKERAKKKNKVYNLHNRDKEANSFYQSKAWKSMRHYIIERDHYQCQVCGEPVNDRKIIDHIVPRRVDKTKQLAESNLWTLCYRCHTYKTQIEEQLLNSNNGTNKVKHLTKERWIKYIKERIYKE